MTGAAPPDLLSEFWTPLCAIGARGPERPNAQICVSVFGASIVPDRPRVLVSLSKTNYTHDLVAASGTLAVTALSHGQLPLLERLGLHSGRDGDKLAGLETALSGADDPYFPGGVGYLACEVLEGIDLGDATAYLCAVRDRETWESAPALRWSEAQTLVGSDFLERWWAKRAREQELARAVMRWA
jgi:flavin reductase (DIM6/NTAB) family NADH-FMN oxidoreductase RutF